MGRRRSSGTGTKVRGAKLEPDLDAALEDFAAEHYGGNISEALKHLLRVALTNETGQSLGDATSPDDGYNAGLRLAASEARHAIMGALKSLWRK